MRNRTWITLGVVLLTAQAATSQAQGGFVVRNVRVFDGQRVLEARDVAVINGKIARIEPTSEHGFPDLITVDGSDRTLLPGLIDAHVHVSDSTAADLRQALALGVTTMLDMFSAGARFASMKAIEGEDRADVASIRSAGTGASAPGGHPSQMGGPPFAMITDSGQSQAFVDARIAEGSDYIKIIYDDLAWRGQPLPRLDERILAGVIAAAHARGKLAVVHAMSEAQSTTAIKAGADGLVHLFQANRWSPEFVRLVKDHNVFVIPTLTVLHAGCGESTGPAVMRDSLLAPFIRPSMHGMMDRAWGPPAGTLCVGLRDNVRELQRQGVTLLTGTDAPAPGHAYGASLHHELQLFVRSGLTPVQALTAATEAPARAFRLADRGRIAPGLRADLLLVEGNPTTDITETRRIVGVWKRGVYVDRRPQTP